MVQDGFVNRIGLVELAFEHFVEARFQATLRLPTALVLEAFFALGVGKVFNAIVGGNAVNGAMLTGVFVNAVRIGEATRSNSVIGVRPRICSIVRSMLADV